MRLASSLAGRKRISSLSMVNRLSWFRGRRRIRWRGWFRGSGSGRGGFLVAIDEGLQIESRQVTVGYWVGANVIERQLKRDAQTPQIGFLCFGKAVRVLVENGLEAEVSFGLARG